MRKKIVPAEIVPAEIATAGKRPAFTGNVPAGRKTAGKRLACAAAVICLAAAALLGGCKKGSSSTPAGSGGGSSSAIKSVKVEKKTLSPDSTVIAVGNQAVKYREFMAYMYILKNRYQNAIDANIWSYNFEDGRSFEYMAKEETVSLITELKIISSKAKDVGIELSSDEMEDIKRYADTVYQSIPETEAAEYGIDSDLLADIYMENEIANKVYDSCISGADEAVNDDSARQITVQYLYKSAENATDADMQKLRNKAAKSKDFLSFAAEKTEADNTEITFGRGDMSDEFTNAAFALAMGELSGVVAADGGYYVIYCVSNYNEEATAQKKEAMIAAQQKKIFEEKYAGWAAGYEVEISNLIL